jgi:hypothetical protein
VIYRYALMSPDGQYRYKLVRTSSAEGRTALWLGINPSTADGEVDDASIRRLYGFGERLGIGTWLVGNLFAYRATDVKKLASAEAPIGPETDKYLAEMMAEANLVIAGWGSIGKVPRHLRPRWKEVVGLAQRHGRDLLCWGTCADGHPLHPLMLPYTSVLRTWEPPE